MWYHNMLGTIRRVTALALVCLLAGMCGIPVMSEAKSRDTWKVGNDEVQIDGYYDDWKDFPVTDITYKSDNGYCIHEGNIYSDGDDLYVHVSMDELYRNQMMFHSFVLRVNDKETAIPILGVKEDGSIDWDVPIYGEMPEGTHKNLAVFLGYYTPCDSSVAFTVYDKEHSVHTKGDEIEFRIRMKDIAKYFNIEEDSIDTIAVYNPNIGAEALICAGSSTAPMAGAAAGFVLVLGVTGIRKFRRKKEMVR